MYYKLIDKESALYKKLYDMRAKELQIEKDNAERIKQRYPKWNDQFLGRKGQQNFDRVTRYSTLSRMSTPKSLSPQKTTKDYMSLTEGQKRAKSAKPSLIA